MKQSEESKKPQNVENNEEAMGYMAEFNLQIEDLFVKFDDEQVVECQPEPEIEE